MQLDPTVAVCPSPGAWTRTLRAMAELRAFPVVYANDVDTLARFYEQLGFVRGFQLPPEGEGEPGYVSLSRGTSEMAIVSSDWPRDQYGLAMGDRPRRRRGPAPGSP